LILSACLIWSLGENIAYSNIERLID
jgi:hypothetical protein